MELTPEDVLAELNRVRAKLDEASAADMAQIEERINQLKRTLGR